jgi:MraZ protein
MVYLGTPSLARRSWLKEEIELMFLGEFNHAIDDKGRLTIPAKYRYELESGAVVTRGYDKCLFIYTVEAFKRFTERAQTLSPTDPANRALLRFAFSGASESTPDKQGRVLIPPFLREYAGLNGECVIVGLGQYIEVWTKEGWADQLQIVNNADTNAQRFAALNLAPSSE